MNRLSVVFLSAEFSETFIHLENKTKQTYATFTGGRVVSDPEGGGAVTNRPWPRVFQSQSGVDNK